MEDYRVVINRQIDMSAFLDMLRYDSAVVLSWDQGIHSDLPFTPRMSDGWYTITLSGRRTADRWRSFGIGTFDAKV